MKKKNRIDLACYAFDLVTGYTVIGKRRLEKMDDKIPTLEDCIMVPTSKLVDQEMKMSYKTLATKLYDSAMGETQNDVVGLRSFNAEQMVGSMMLFKY